MLAFFGKLGFLKFVIMPIYNTIMVEVSMSRNGKILSMDEL